MNKLVLVVGIIMMQSGFITSLEAEEVRLTKNGTYFDGGEVVQDKDGNLRRIFDKSWDLKISNLELEKKFERHPVALKRKSSRFADHRLSINIADMEDLTFSAGAIPRYGMTGYDDDSAIAGLRIRYAVDERISIVVEAAVPSSKEVKRENGTCIFIAGSIRY